ncbi:TerD family protein [Streptomyces sp. GD-15H]
MCEMVKGADVGLATLSDTVDSVIASLGWVSQTGEGDADVSVLLLGAHGKVRSDADFYFYNNPVAADGGVELLGKKPAGEGSEDRIVFDLTVDPNDVERIVVAASRYEGMRFDELDGLQVTLANGSGDGLLRFPIEGAGSVSAFIFGELYRRAGEWKFRAVGQGYDTGLAGPATDFGVDIDDDEAEAVAAARADEAEGPHDPAAVGGPTTGIEIPASDQGYPLTRAKRLIKWLSEAPADLHIETLADAETGGPRGTPERLRPEPGDLLPKNGTQITGFRLTLFKGMGSTRGNAEAGFIRSVDDAVNRFYSTVVVHLERPTSRKAVPTPA